MESGGTPNFSVHGGLVDDLVLAPVVLHHTGTADALPQVLVGGDDQHLLDPRVGGSHGGGSGQGVVGLPLDHRPRGEPGGHEQFLHHGNLVEQHGVHPLTALVARVQVVAEALDDMVAGDGDVGGPRHHQLQRAGHHTRSGVEGAGIAVASDLAEVLAEQLVGAVDEVDLHAERLVIRRF
jgi:hypothetical protein